MEGVPRGLDPAAVLASIETVEGVSGAHHLHLWNLASDVPAASAHVVLAGQPTH
jgi:cobalt-zinc-cadmium efflux system protein